MMRLLASLLFLVIPTALWAGCTGSDLRTTLSDAQRAELAQRMEGVPFPKGNHWKATRDGRSVHLIGTMHIDDPRMKPLAARLAPLIERADTLLVEANREDQTALQRAMAEDPSLVFLTGKTLIELMEPEDWAMLSAAAEARGIPSFMAAKFQPWFLSLMMGVSPCETQAMSQGSGGLDERLMDIAEDAGVPVRSLEDPRTIFRLFSQDPLEEQIRLLTIGILPDAFAENATATLKEQYFDEDTHAALEVARITARPMIDLPPGEFDALFDDFIDIVVRMRNEAWIAPIEAAQGDLIVVASGALHLSGEHGLVNLLVAEGYSVERLPF